MRILALAYNATTCRTNQKLPTRAKVTSRNQLFGRVQSSSWHRPVSRQLLLQYQGRTITTLSLSGYARNMNAIAPRLAQHRARPRLSSA
jgi:hypothetical protein